ERDRALPPPIPTLIGEIGAVANVYDNLMSGSPSRPPMPPDTTLQAIRSAAGTHLNRAVVVAFLRVVPVYPLGTEVLVRSERYRGFSGLVTRVNVARLDKPTILLLHDAQGNTIAPVELNLNTEPDLEIRCKGL
ncbi:MAG: hypothetical protein HY706_07500, partial [Candidatus Hydrogenedentes bacterium]|nr:hypothetical protein [Candidatus Hydrogenedentota bacterium]